MANKELRALESRIDARRVRIEALTSGLAVKIRTKAVSPPALIAAGAVGFVVEQGSRHRVTSLANTLTALQVYGTAAFAVLDWMDSDNTA